MNAIEIITPAADTALIEHAAVIRALGKRVVGDIVEIGRRLAEAKEIVGHGNWLPWLEREFAWGEDTAKDYIAIYRTFGNRDRGPDLTLPMRSLRMLAAPSTPEEARTDVIGRAEAGEKLTVADVQKAVKEALAKQAQASHSEMRKLAEMHTAQLRERVDQREKEVRAEYANKIAVDPAELQKQVTEALQREVEPLQRKLDAAEKRLAAVKKADAERKKVDASSSTAPTAAVPKIDSRLSMASTSIQLGISRLRAALEVTPADVVRVEALIGGAVNQSMSVRLGKAVAEATDIVVWLNEFVSRVSSPNGANE